MAIKKLKSGQWQGERRQGGRVGHGVLGPGGDRPAIPAPAAKERRGGQGRVTARQARGITAKLYGLRAILGLTFALPLVSA